MGRIVAILWLALMASGAFADPKLRLTSNVVWHHDADWFGGFSGLEIGTDGAKATLITDKGRLVIANVIREAGQIRALQLLSDTPLKDADGNTLTGKDTDAEGLAISTQGDTYISFEHRHRIARVLDATGRTLPLTQSNAFAAMDLNSGLEALAVHPDGSLFALPEQSTSLGFPLWRLRDGTWKTILTIPRKGPFLPVGADFDSDGRLYLLERAVTPLGFRSRIRRVDLHASNSPPQTLLTTRPARFDNLEAISLWQNTSGLLHLTMIADDNFLSIQRTQIVEYTLTE